MLCVFRSLHYYFRTSVSTNKYNAVSIPAVTIHAWRRCTQITMFTSPFELLTELARYLNVNFKTYLIQIFQMLCGY